MSTNILHNEYVYFLYSKFILLLVFFLCTLKKNPEIIRPTSHSAHFHFYSLFHCSGCNLEHPEGLVIIIKTALSLLFLETRRS